MEKRFQSIAASLHWTFAYRNIGGTNSRYHLGAFPKNILDDSRRCYRAACGDLPCARRVEAHANGVTGDSSGRSTGACASASAANAYINSNTTTTTIAE